MITIRKKAGIALIVIVILAFALLASVALVPGMMVTAYAGSNDSVYTPLSVTGFDADVVADDGSWSNGLRAVNGKYIDTTEYTIEKYGHVFVSKSFGKGNAFPAGETISTASGKSYTLQSSTANNALQVARASGFSSKTLRLTTPGSYEKIGVLSTGGGGDASLRAVVHYSDGSQSEPISLSCPDWYGGSAQLRVYGPLSRTQNFNRYNIEGTGAYLFETTINVDPDKAVTSIDFNFNGNNNAVANIFAISGVAAELKHTVTFDLNGHGDTAPAIQKVSPEGKATKPSDPQESTYIFSGWYKESNCETAWDFATDTVTSNITLYAKWVDKPQEHDGITFTVWRSNNSLPGSAGSYYLTSDVTISSTWNVPSGTTNLCLNGYGIKMTGNNSVVTVSTGAKLKLYDCDTTTVHKYSVSDAKSNGAGFATVNDALTSGYRTFIGGYITGGKGTPVSSWSRGGAFYIEGAVEMYGGTIIGNGQYGVTHGGGFNTQGSGTFKMYGGSIQNNAGGCGGATRLQGSGSCEIYGGKIINNIVSADGGGIHVGGSISLILKNCEISGNYAGNGPGAGIWMTTTGTEVSGKTVIENNLTNSSESNVEIGNGYVISVGKLTEGARIGVKLNNGGTGAFTSGWSTYMEDADPADYFTSDNDQYSIFLLDGEASILKPMAATAQGYSGDYDGEAHGITVTPSEEGVTIKYGTAADNCTLDALTYADAGEYTIYYKVTKTDYMPISGSETVTIASINVTVAIKGHSARTGYDGKEHKVVGYDVAADNELYDVTKDMVFNGEAELARIDAGMSYMQLDPSQFENVNSNFVVTFTVSDGYLIVSPVSVRVTVIGHKKTVNYDGEEHSVSGYDVTFSNPLYSDSDFSFEGSATATQTEVGVMQMGLEAKQFKNKNNNFSTVTFKVTDGYIKVKSVEVKVTIVGKTERVDYDGTEHTVSGYDVTISNDLYTVEDFTFSGDASATLTDAGTAYMGLTAEQFTNNNANYANVVFSVTDGSIVVNPIDVTVTIVGKTESVDYDGAEHTVSGYGVAFSNDLYTAEDFAFSGEAVATLTDAGTAYMGLTTEKFANINANFATVTFDVTDGSIEVKPIDVTVTIVGKTESADYDGAEHTVSGYDVAFSNDLYTAEDFTFSGDASATLTDAGTAYMGLTVEQFTNTNDNFANVTFEVTDGSIEVKPIDVTVTIVGKTESADYDGKEHTVSGYGVAFSNDLYTAEDFTFNGDATVTLTDAGTAYMNLAADQFANTNANFATVTFNVTDGYLMVKGINVTVTIVGKTESVDYDGVAHTVSGYDVAFSNDLYTAEDFTFSGEAVATLTDAGTAYMGLAASQFVNTNTNFATVTFDVTDGYIKVNAIDVTVTVVGKTDSANYDGAKHTVSGYDVAFSNNLYTAEDFAFSGDATVTLTDAGTAYMGLTAEQFANINANFATVTFNVTDGSIEVKPIDVTVTVVGKTASVDYDGTEHTVSGYDVAFSNDLYTAEDFTFNGDATVTLTDAGTAYMGLIAEKFANINANFDAVTFEVTDGSIEVNPIDVTVTIVGKTESVDYDGKEHTVSGYDVTIDSDLYTAADFTFSGNATATLLNAGTAYMELAASQFANTNANFATVTFEVTDGYVTVNPIDVTVTIVGKTDSVDYDGTEHTVSGYDVAFSSALYTAEDFTFNGDATATLTDAGTAYMGLTAEMFANINANFATVSFEVTDGSIEVKPIDVTVTIVGKTESVDYDGKEHTVSGYDVAFSSALYTAEDFTFNGDATVTLTNAGTAYMGLTAEQFTNTNDNFANVTFEVTDGSIEVKPIDVTVIIVGKTGSADYDGVAHTVSGYDVTISNDLYTVEDFTFSGDASATLTDAGTAYIGLTAEQFTNTNDNFATVTFNVTDGYVTVNPIDVTVTIVGKTESVDYDGVAYTVSGYDVAFSNDLYTAEDFTFNGDATVTLTDAGTAYMGLTAEKFANINANFDAVTFNVTDGFVEVTPIDVTVTIVGKTESVDYDGVAHTVSGYDVAFSNDLYTAEDFTFNGDATVTLIDAGTAYMNLAADQFANTNANFANVTFEVTDGYIKVNAIDVTVTIVGKSDTVDYDGEEHTVSGYEVEISSDLYTVGDFTFSGNATATLLDVGTAYMGLEASQFANINPNFATVTFDVTDGYIKVNAIDVTVTVVGKTESVDYDGVAHTVSGYGVAFSNDLYTAEDFTFSGEAVATLTDAGTEYMGLAADQFANTNANFANVTFEVTDGYVTVNKKGVTVTADAKSKTYGDADPLLTATIDGLVGTDKLNYTLVREAGEKIGDYAITVTLGVNPNYDVVVTNGTFTINRRSLTVTADAKSKTYGDADPALTYTAVGLVGTDAFTGVLSREEGEKVGAYEITLGTLTAGNNYGISFNGAFLTIMQKTEIKVEVKSEEGEDEIAVAVDGLDRETQAIKELDPTAGEISVVMTVEQKTEDEISEEPEEESPAKTIQNVAQDKNLEFYEIKVEKTVDSVTTLLEETDTVLEIAIPYAKANKRGLTVYSYHDDRVVTFIESDQKAAGTFRVDKENNIVYVYTNTFSVYAIGYTPYYRVATALNLGSYKGTATVTLTNQADGTMYTKENADPANIVFSDLSKGKYVLTVTWTDGATNTISMPVSVGPVDPISMPESEAEGEEKEAATAAEEEDLPFDDPFEETADDLNDVVVEERRYAEKAALVKKNNDRDEA